MGLGFWQGKVHIVSMPHKILGIFGDYWHAPGPIEHAFRRAIGSSTEHLDAVVDPALLPWNELHTYDLIILSKEGRVPGTTNGSIWMSLEQEQAVADFVAHGGSLFGFHSGLCTYHPAGPMRKLQCGHFVTHPPDEAYTVHPAVETHPILHGVADFSVFDELYHVDTDPNETEVFLHSASAQHGPHISGWTHRHGQGRFVALTPGHSREVLNHPAIQRLMGNIIHYLLNR